ncbi:hypothetical protein VC83_05628 [Pseudogymnoascus destructans]|uniref:RRM domain-containing protein n=1 Tax=Pseudogymnoascus destructans TaxID=655981 RepID=A0A177A6U3_9PEZI|nr:uncharacterized protein VC83_05628 [Pseudogymnoascus destructans]OAF57847.2 hypothetical protein VC83_05628 [Pseudogymnoascus destructans]
MLPMAPLMPPNGFIELPVVPGYVPPELFTNFPLNAPAFFSTNLRSRAIRLVPKPAPQYAVRTNDPNDIYERANSYRDKYPDFVHTIQSLPIAWDDLYTYFDPLDIWMEGAGFCFHVIHRLAGTNIEKRRQIESFVNEWSVVNLAKLARVPPNTPVIAAFEPEDYQYFDFDNLAPTDIVDVCNFLAQRCYALQPQLHLIREGLARSVEIDRNNFAPPVPTRSGRKAQHQIPWQESPNSDAIGLGIASARESTGEYQHRREVSFEKNCGIVRYPQCSQTKIEPIYTYNPHRISRSGPVALAGPILTAVTPPRDFKDRALANDDDQNRVISGSKPRVNRNRAYSNVSRNKTFTKYEAVALVEVKTAILDPQNPAGKNYYIQNSAKLMNTVIEEGRSIYIRGFTDDEFTSDLVPTMMECCGEIGEYRPIKGFAFMTFKAHTSATEAIRRFNGFFYDGGVLIVAPYRRKAEFDNRNGPNRYQGDSFRGNQRYMNDHTGDPSEAGEHRRTYKTTERDQNASVSNNGAQMPRKESSTPSKRHNTPSIQNLAIKKTYIESGTMPRCGKGPTSSGQSTKTTKSVDTGKLRSDSISDIPTKKGSFVSEDLSVPEEGKYGTSFSSYSSSFTHKESIFDESPAETLLYHTMKIFESSFGNKESSITSGVISVSPERRDPSSTMGESDRLGKKKKKKLKNIDFNVIPTAGTGHSTRKMTGEAMSAEALKAEGVSDANNDDAGSSNPLKLDSKTRDEESSTQPTSSKSLTGIGEFGGRAPLKRPTKVNHGSPRKLTTDEGSPRSSKKKHGKTDSNTSSFGIEARVKKYEGYEPTTNEITYNAGEAPQSEARNHVKVKFFKRNKSSIDLKENTHSERVLPATEVNILADPTHWPSLGEGKPSCHGHGHSTVAPLNPAPDGCLVTARRNSMAAIISQKTRIVPAVPLLLRSVTMAETRSVSSDSAKSDDTIITVANTTGTRLWPAVVKWAGKPPSTDVVENQPEAADPASCP